MSPRISRSNPRNHRGTVALPLAGWLTALPLVTALVQDWYVDVNAPLCPGGIGTQADPFCDIMNAVAAAADGDTIHIAPGTYFENVVLAKDLELIGTGGQSVTIVDGGAAGGVIHVVQGQVTLTGLTLQNGVADSGGGLSVGGCSTVVLASSTVTGNLAVRGFFYGGRGGGIANYGDLTLIGTTVLGNAAYTFGSGIYSGSVFSLSSSLTLTNSTIRENTFIPGGLETGVGVWAYSPLTMQTSSVSDNGHFGVLANGPTSFIANSSVTNHSACGIAADYSLTVIGSRVHGNGDGICVSANGPAPTLLTLTNSSISGNSGVGVKVGRGSGSYYYYPADAYITNCTITGNSGGAMLVQGSLTYPSHAAIANSIVWDNGPSSIALSGTGASSTADYSLVEGGWPGVGNLDADPSFVDPLNGDFRLLPGSPCIDAGSNLLVPPGVFTDLDGKLRFIDDPLTPDTGRPGRLWPIVDMGAHEFGLEPPRKVRRR